MSHYKYPVNRISYSTSSPSQTPIPFGTACIPSNVQFCPKNEPQNLNQINTTFCSGLKAVKAYYGSTNMQLVDPTSDYYADVLTVTSSLRQYIDNFLSSSQYSSMKSQNITPLIMFDMDDTIWCVYGEYIQKGYCYSPTIFLEESYSQQMPPIFPVQDILRYCAMNGIIPVFVSGRGANNTQADATTIQLQGMNLRAGKDYWGGLFGWNDKTAGEVVTPQVHSIRGVFYNPTKDTASIYKSRTRKYIEDNGLPGIGRVLFIAAVGDQLSDSYGGSTLLRVKLPNPLYFLP